MTAVDAILETAKELIILLNEVELIEGETLTRSEVESESTILFWHSLAKNSGGNKDTYLVWNVMPGDTLLKVDDKEGVRRLSAIIDVFTRYSITDESIQTLLKNINTQAIRSLWECEVFEAPNYDPEFGRTRITLQLSKKIYR